MYVLVNFDDNWADEFDLTGHSIMTEIEWEAYQDRVKKYFKEHNHAEIYFGTNEALEYTSAEDVLNTFTVKPITSIEYEIIERLFGTSIGETCVLGYFED